MDPGPYFIAALAIVGWSARSIARAFADASVRKQELRNAVQGQSAGVSSSEIHALRDEIARLRETTTQHALSLQHSVERLDHRVEFMERKSIDTAPPTSTQQQNIARS